MNCEIIKTSAAEAIEEWKRSNDGPCFLIIKNGAVRARDPKRMAFNPPSCTVISKWEQRHGLTSASWNSRGTELLNQYNKEKLCQHLQKP